MGPINVCQCKFYTSIIIAQALLTSIKEEAIPAVIVFYEHFSISKLVYGEMLQLSYSYVGNRILIY